MSFRAELEVLPGGGVIDLLAAERAVADLLIALGRPPVDDHTAETPRRVAAAYAELHGLLRSDARSRNEFFALTGVGR